MAGNNIYVQGSYIDVHDNEVVNLSVDKAQVKLSDGQQAAVPVCPPQLDTPRAHELWERAIAEGWVDERRQPLLSRPMAALLADRMATVLDITAKWKVFEQMWHRKNMRNDYNTALEQQQCDEYRKKFARVIR